MWFLFSSFTLGVGSSLRKLLIAVGVGTMSWDLERSISCTEFTGFEYTGVIRREAKIDLECRQHFTV